MKAVSERTVQRQWEKARIYLHGEQYRLYRSGVSMIVPWPAKRKQPEEVNRVP